MIPCSFSAAAIVPATCVPWPLSSLHGSVLGKAVNPGRRIFACRSGCVAVDPRIQDGDRHP